MILGWTLFRWVTLQLESKSEMSSDASKGVVLRVSDLTSKLEEGVLGGVFRIRADVGRDAEARVSEGDIPGPSGRSP